MASLPFPIQAGMNSFKSLAEQTGDAVSGSLARWELDKKKFTIIHWLFHLPHTTNQLLFFHRSMILARLQHHEFVVAN